jgi:hypothetical protein
VSLIDEALKRAELEAARRDGLRSGAYPWVPEHATKPRRRWIAFAAVVAVAAAAGGGAWWLSRRPVEGPASRSQAEASKIQNPKPKTELENVEVAPPPVGQPSRVQARGPFDSPKAGEGPPARTTAAADVVEVHAPPGPQGRSEAAAAATESKPPVKKAAEGKTYVGEVKLPDGAKIELGGIVYSDVNPVALINDHVLGPGAVVEEFEIVSIQPDRVELKGRGITIFLKLK